MRVIAVLSFMALCCIRVAAEGGAKIEHLDASRGESGEHQLVYVTNSGSEESIKRTAFVVLHKSGKQELAYGYYVEKGTAKVGLIDSKIIEKVGRVDDSKTVITIVRVSDEQYEETKAIIKTWTEKEEEIDGPSIVFYNSVCQILKACGMKIPYRSAYRAPNPVQWIGDIPAYSRDLVVR